MSGTIELINKKIIEKITSTNLAYSMLQHLTEILDAQNVEYKKQLALQFLYLNLIIVDFENLESSYNLSVVHILNAYYTKSVSTDYTREFYQIINSDNYLAKIDEFLRKADTILSLLISAYIKSIKSKGASYYVKPVTKKAAAVDRVLDILDDGDVTPVVVNSPTLAPNDPLLPIVEKIKKQIEYTQSIVIVVDSGKSPADICSSCGHHMIAITSVSEMVCENWNCQEVKKLDGTEIDETKTIEREKKKGAYHPHKHFRLHMEHLQARETKIIPISDQNKIKRIIERDKLELEHVSEMRSVLKECKLTKYNENAPLLMKMFTDKSPPQLSYSVIKQIAIKFIKILTLLETLINTEVNNRKYYPYFIYKIIESEIQDYYSDYDANTLSDLKRLLCYIHLQSDETLRKNDAIYKEICEKDAKRALIDGDRQKLIYRKTERRN